jgi:hypothetical protein
MTHMPCPRVLAMTVTLAVSIIRPVSAQTRPLPVEAVDGAGAGNMVIQTSADYTRSARFTLSGLEGTLWRLALVRLDVGLSSMADFEISGGLRDHLAITSRAPAVLSDQLRLSNPAATGAFDDIIVGTKIRLRGEQDATPGLAFRVATRLPNAKHPSGLGQNTTDFYSSVIVGQSIADLRLTGNIGLGVLGDPLSGNRRVDSWLYNMALSHPIGRDTSFAVGVDGRTGRPEPGLESRAIGRVGAEWSHGPTRLGLAATMGLTNRDGNFGAAFTLGVTFRALAP